MRDGKGRLGLGRHTNRIDRIRRVHAQRHTTASKQTWAKSEQGHRPWFCKASQSGTCSFTKDHEVQGKLHKHICAHCLSHGRCMTHSEKDCYFAKKDQIKKPSN